ncbi:urease accessory protein UreF [Actinomadura algeriensis]|uniref:Urease accessory protein UreF n=1 Tax=Actinomadura algeriensis TaxID=1679523 RepID=A0ABR9K3J2_9ACTN|nr:urease accessory UreF family protein [Actinomadura algeriensis]MBE1537168.1 urease accessory protein [Actinomadura algeriensis]
MNGRDAGLPALLLLADGRFPAGGHAHSGGLEAAAAAGLVRDPATLRGFLLGRLHTAGLTAAAFAAAAGGPGAPHAELDAELDARTPSPALRGTSRRLGRQLLRAARAVRPAPVLGALAAAFPAGPHHPVALGAAAGAWGLPPRAAALAALHDAAAGPAAAAIRLLGLDPFAVHAVLADLGPALDALADEAARHAAAPPAALPAPGAPRLDVSAEDHSRWEVHLFAS